MGKINQKLFETVASVKIPVFAGFDTESGVADTVVGFHKCENCDSHIVLNCLNAPACPICAGSLVLVNEDTNTELKASDFKNLEKLCSCDTCSTTWNSKNETVAKLQGETIHCMVCTSPIVVKADESDENDVPDKEKANMNKSNDSGSSSTDDNSDTSSTNDSSKDTTSDTDTTEADKELDEALKKLGVKDTDTKKDDTVKKDDSKVESADGDQKVGHAERAKELHKKIMGSKDPSKEDLKDFNESNKAAMDHHETKADEAFDKGDADTEKKHNTEKRVHKKMQKEVDAHAKRYGGEDKGQSNIEASDEEDEDEDNTNDNNNDGDDEDEELDASELVYHIALKNIKSAELLHSNDYGNWYLFSDKSPIAVASFENADNTVKNVFRSNDYSTAFTAAVSADGLNPELMKDFGFKPIKVDVTIDKLSQELIKERVDEKTRETNDKLNALSEMYDQSLGTAAIGTIKGFYENDGGFREGLIAQFSAVRARDPEILVESFLNKYLPDLMRSVVVTAKELMNKTPEALNEVSAMVDSAKPRSIVKKKAEIPAIAIHSQAEIIDEKPDNRNFGKERTAASAISIVDALFSGVKDKTRISRN